MATFKDDYVKYIEEKVNITNMIDELKQKIEGIVEEHGCDSYLETIPPEEQTLEQFFVQDDVLYTNWYYNDPYDEICSGETDWRIPLSWFEMNLETLTNTIIASDKLYYDNEVNIRINRLRHEAEHFGYELIKK